MYIYLILGVFLFIATMYGLLCLKPFPARAVKSPEMFVDKLRQYTTPPVTIIPSIPTPPTVLKPPEVPQPKNTEPSVSRIDLSSVPMFTPMTTLLRPQ